MSEEVKIEVIRTTQDSLSKYIKKPPLTEKLLRKPPFRYLHDITTAVMRETGYLKGLYSQDELNPENIKDRDAKIAFLEKLIAVVNLSTGATVAARPNKIVAGLDVVKTNELLQIIAKALDKKVDSSQAVEQVLNKKSKGVKQEGSNKKETSKSKPSKDAKPAETKSRESRNSESLKRKTKDKVKSSEKTDPRKVKAKKDVSPTKLSKKPSVDEPSIEANKADVPLPEPPAAVEEERPTPLQHVEDDVELKHDEKPLVPVEIAEPPPAVEQRESKEHARSKEERLTTHEQAEQREDAQELKVEQKKEDSTGAEEVKRPQSARAVHRKKSSRKPTNEVDHRSPSRREGQREETVLVEAPAIQPAVALENKPPAQSEISVPKRPRTAARPASARPGAPRVRDRGTVLLTDNDNKVVSEPVNLIVDSKELSKEDDETLVSVEAPVADVAADQGLDESQLVGGDQGHLVSQILETQKELEDTAVAGEAVAEAVPKVDITWSSGQREQEAVVREVDKLRAAIQTLTRAANPLGKLIDYLQEDVESMQTELDTWVATNQQLTAQLQAEERLTEESIEPLVSQLEVVSELVEEQLEETSAVKAAILRNDERIARLLRGSTGQSH